MEASILTNGDLKITVTAEEQEALRERRDENPDAFCSNDVLHDLFGPLLANSAFGWVRPEEVGALTDAPLLGVRGEDGEVAAEAWGFMDYALCSPQEELLARGACVFLSGEEPPEKGEAGAEE